MRDHLDRFGDAAVAVVTFAAPDRLAAYRQLLDLPFPVVTDPQLGLYRALGAGRGRWHHLFSWGTIRLYARLLLRERRRPQVPREDIRQLGADVVVGRDGRIRYVALPEGPDRRPPVDDLIAALDRSDPTIDPTGAKLRRMCGNADRTSPGG